MTENLLKLDERRVMDKQKALDSALAQIERNFGKGSIMKLGQRGYNVLQATTGAEALEMFAGHQGEVDLVVSDVVMPEMDGPTLCGHLRRQRPDLKVIFISGYAEDSFRRNLVDTDFLFLSKPFSLNELTAKVKVAMDARPSVNA